MPNRHCLCQDGEARYEEGENHYRVVSTELLISYIKTYKIKLQSFENNLSQIKLNEIQFSFNFKSKLNYLKGKNFTEREPLQSGEMSITYIKT